MQPAAIPTTMEMTIWKNFITMPTTAIGICAYSVSYTHLAERDELRRVERDLRHRAAPLTRDEPLVEADSEPRLDHVVGRKAVSRRKAGLRVQVVLLEQAVLIGVVIGRGVDERLFLQAAKRERILRCQLVPARQPRCV